MQAEYEVHDQIYEISSLKKVVQFQITHIPEDNLTMIKIINVSNSVILSQEKSQNELMSLINATMSHELRNPLNYMCAQKFISNGIIA